MAKSSIRKKVRDGIKRQVRQYNFSRFIFNRFKRFGPAAFGNHQPKLTELQRVKMLINSLTNRERTRWRRAGMPNESTNQIVAAVWPLSNAEAISQSHISPKVRTALTY